MISLLPHRWAWSLMPVVCLFSVATAQVPRREAPPPALRPISPGGIVVATTPETITVRSQSGMAGPEPVRSQKERVSVSGRLTVQGMSGTLQSDGQTLNLKFTERTHVYEERPATANDGKVGNNVMLDLRVVDRKFVTKGIDILPPYGSGVRIPGRPRKPLPADAPQK